ncbi:N-acetylglutaminylglutamine amidotransferase [Brevibacterium otitidis]|uniref:asparagine synthase (glutamine-hydrolyzing) n=1 Tax=Brevibacterium otitidis TaxID=53364 RepID=A0ABV5X4I0_9MICO|nr:N-acetylglutaminylglutamine amidotransferase [Brevibacterium otitidis]
MSGICGQISTAQTSHADAKAAVDAMTRAMAGRGPDGEGLLDEGRVVFGHRRLAVIDLGENGAQPMRDPDVRMSIVLNGAIYNYRELREELHGLGHSFRTASDTEVVLKAFAQWREQALDRLQGMFALAIHEEDTGRVFLARDRMGVRPLYYAEVGGAFRFASTLPALLAAGGIDTRIDLVALNHYMTFHAVVPAPFTMLAGVRKLPPATYLWIETDGAQTQTQYWEPRYGTPAEKADWTDTDWQDAILDSLRTAVRRRLVADVPVGVLLSGGLDSSLIVGLIDESGQQDIETFSIGFESFGGEEGDEFKYSDIIAEHFNTSHHQLRISTERMLPALDEAIGVMSEPMVSHDAVAFYLLSQEVAKHVTVVQSGQGADEVFAGYHWYPPMYEAGEDVEAALASYQQAFFDRSYEEMGQLVSAQFMAGSDVSTEFVDAHFRSPGAISGIDRALRLDTTIMAVDDPVKRVDNMTMAAGLEARMPFLDHDLVQLAAECPARLKTAQEGKGILKEVGRRVIPSEVIDRPKGYFPVPALKHLQGPYLEKVREAISGPVARERGLFQPAAVEALLAAPNENLTPLRGNRLWQIALLELWLQNHGITGPAV